jgi:hypothetical protein
VSQADALVVIVAQRYGWVPDDPKRNPEGKSITWLECEEAVANGQDVTAFVIDDHADWPADLSDKADLDVLMEWDDDEEAEAQIKAIRKRIKQLKTFKQWLGSRGLRRTFKTKQELKLEVERALKAWRPQPASPHPAKPSGRLAIPAG